MIYSLLTRDRGEVYEIVETDMDKTILQYHWREFCLSQDYDNFQRYIIIHDMDVRVLTWDVIWDRNEK